MSTRRMLILDDDPAVGQTIQWIAEGLGLEAEFVTNAQDFFAGLDRRCADFITVDLAMPNLDGVEVMRLLAERKCASRIIISSGMGNRVLAAAERSAAEHGLDIAGVIAKPISKAALRSMVGEASEGKESVWADETAYEFIQNEAIDQASLQGGLDRHEFELAYQPKVDCRSGVPAGFEALARWRRHGDGLVMPVHFIPVAEETGLIEAFTAQVFGKSIAWFGRSFPDSGLKLSLNLSAKSLVDIQLVDRLSSVCTEFQVAPERIVIELTETSAMVDPVLSLDLMTRFRVKGFQLSIDDFGTGYSSMVQLVRLPFSEIKVDKSFVMNARQSQESRSVIKSIIDLGHSLGLVVTAEGVEDAETFDYLKSQGCDYAQGYFIARPMTGETARKWVSERNAAVS